MPTRSEASRVSMCALLYLATLVGLKHNSVLRVLDERLHAACKPFNVAATACMRKLLTIQNAMLRHNQR